MRADLEVWSEWAKRANLDERIIQFVNANPQHFLELPKEGVKAWPTPRSWHMCADVIIGLSDNEVYPYVLASVGSVSSVFSAWLKYLRSIDVDSIIESGKFPSDLSRDKLFTVVQAVASKIDKKIIKKIQNRKLQTLFESIPSEYKIVFLKELVTYKENRKDVSALQAFIEEVPEAVRYIESLVA